MHACSGQLTVLRRDAALSWLRRRGREPGLLLLLAATVRQGCGGSGHGWAAPLGVQRLVVAAAKALQRKRLGLAVRLLCAPLCALIGLQLRRRCTQYLRSCSMPWSPLFASSLSRPYYCAQTLCCAAL